MPARDGDLHRALGHLLALHLREVRRAGGRARVAEDGAEIHRGGLRPAAVGARDEVRGVREVLHRPHAQALDDGRLVRVRGGDQQVRHARRAQADRERQHAAHGAQVAAERELAGEGGVVEVEDGGGRRRGRRAGARPPARGAGDDRLRGEQHPERDRQVEERAVLVDVRRGEIDHDPPAERFEAGVRERRLHAMAALLHARVRQADDDGLRVSRARDVDLDLHEEGVDAGYGAGKQAGEAGHLRVEGGGAVD